LAIGDLALQRIVDIVDAGLPGYTQSCNACKTSKRACQKHAENVKI